MDTMQDEVGAREVPTVERLDPGLAVPEAESEPSRPIGSGDRRRWAAVAAIGGAAALSGLGLGLAVMARTGRLGGRFEERRTRPRFPAFGSLSALTMSPAFQALQAVDPDGVRQSVARSIEGAMGDRRSAVRRALAARRAVTERRETRSADAATPSRRWFRRSPRPAEVPPKGERWAALRPVVRFAALSLALSLGATFVSTFAARRMAASGATPTDEAATPTEPAAAASPAEPQPLAG
jgi:hypothetical protein